ncbi:MAG: UDP-N-acetylmuramoyl-L-alanyl-D-glutamate--2,6-diaminopimelate ligase [Candidatus Saccharimonadales bacterium]
MRKLVKRLVPKQVFKKVEPYGHLAEAIISHARFGFPARDLRVIGVTGTDGKTTTCNLIKHMLRESGLKVAMITTVSVDYGDGKGEQPNPSGLTTPGSSLLVQLLKQIRQNNVDWVILETGSHALAQHRVWGIPFSLAVMTNMSHEHLDYHGTFARYRDAKRQLFKLCNQNRYGLQTGVINGDDDTASFFAKDILHPITYGINAGELRATSIKSTAAGSTFNVVLASSADLAPIYSMTCNLRGAFNVYNCLAAVAVGRAIGLERSAIESGIASLKSVPGRMERIVAGQPYEVIVDYAVTPAALETVLRDARTTATGKVILVFGATGDRDRLKRPIMGAVAARHADQIFLTDDETYTEDGSQIRRAVLSGITTAGGVEKTTEIADRRQAIEHAFTTAKAGDTVLITGIGHQKYRNMGGHKQAWDERQISRDILDKMAIHK